MTLQTITSKDNPAFRALRALSLESRSRREAGRTVLDGVHLIEACLAAGLVPDSLWLSESGLLNPEIAKLIAGLGQVRQVVLPDSLFAQGAPTDSPTGVMAVMVIPPAAVVDAKGTVLVLDGVQDAGNVGTLLRTAAAAGVDQVWLTPGCAAAWSPRVLRAGMGAQFCLSIAEGVDALAALKDTDSAIIATSLGTSDSVFDADLRGPTVWLFGAEGRGLSSPLQARATRLLTIPMPGKIESLNVAASAAICLFEQVRQRRGGNSRS